MDGKLAVLFLASAIIGGLFCLDRLNNSSDLVTALTPPPVADRCQLLERPREWEREGQNLWCDDLIPRYDMAQWLREHGKVMPDHPAIFVNTSSHEAEIFKDTEAFLAQHGDERVVAKPEYMQAGGHLQDPTSPSNVNATLRQLAQIWNPLHLYVSDFKCENGSLCAHVSQQFGQPALFQVPPRRLASKNFLVGGMGSGLPFHRHHLTWQGLSLGRKAWYVIPPGSMSEEMHNLTGPFLFPARTFHGALLKEPVGRRPLFCVQHVGEVIFLPSFWWHATMNLDGYEVAYGEKPMISRTQENSEALAKIMRVFPQTLWDSAGHTAEGKARVPTMVYYLTPKISEFRRTCGNTSSDLDKILKWMVAPSNAHRMACGLKDVAAWAHCHLMTEARNMKAKCRSNISGSKLTEISQQMESWKRTAKELSHAVTERESRKCG